MNLLSKAVRKAIPRPFHIYLFRPHDKSAKHAKVRNDVRKLPLNEHAFLEVYWKIYGMGKGPAIILNIHGHEVAKFDCYGQDVGHYHIQVTEWRRKRVNILRLPETTREAQIERAIFELRNNARWYLDRHPLWRVRRVEMDRARLREATDQARALLRTYIGKVEG